MPTPQARSIVRSGKDYFGSPNTERSKLEYEMGVVYSFTCFIAAAVY
jgi:hypothetical protein